MVELYDYDFNIEESDDERTWDFATVQSSKVIIYDKELSAQIRQIEEYWDAIMELIAAVAGYYRAQGHINVGGDLSRVSFWENKMSIAIELVMEKSPNKDNVPVGRLNVLKKSEDRFRKKAREYSDSGIYVSPENFFKQS